jgi:histidinol-phosphate aminotransferase
MTALTGSQRGPRPRIDPLSAYRRPPVPEHVLKLDANEGAYPPRDLAAAVTAGGAELLRRYPTITGLERALASRLSVADDRVIATAGAGDALDRACRAFLSPGRDVLVPLPSFEMIDRYVRVAWGELTTIPWMTGPFPRDAFIEGAARTPAAIMLVSPNNPTGAALAGADLAAVARAAPDSLIVLDHAYVEYADEDLTAIGLEFPNVLVVRTLSKAWGLAGCRVGYAIGTPEVLGALRAAGPSYPLAAPAVAIACAQLARGDDAMQAHVARIRDERSQLLAMLERVGLRPYPSQANFVLVDCGRDAAPLRVALDERGVRVRDFPDRAGLERCLRITLPGSAGAFTVLMQALHTVFATNDNDSRLTEESA